MSKTVFLSWLKGSKYNNIISAYKNVLFTFSELNSKSSFCNKFHLEILLVDLVKLNPIQNRPV